MDLASVHAALDDETLSDDDLADLWVRLDSEVRDRAAALDDAKLSQKQLAEVIYERFGSGETDTGRGRVKVSARQNVGGWRHTEVVNDLIKAAAEAPRQIDPRTGEVETPEQVALRALAECASWGKWKAPTRKWLGVIGRDLNEYHAPPTWTRTVEVMQ